MSYNLYKTVSTSNKELSESLDIDGSELVKQKKTLIGVELAESEGEETTKERRAVDIGKSEICGDSRSLGRYLNVLIISIIYGIHEIIFVLGVDIIYQVKTESKRYIFGSQSVVIQDSDDISEIKYEKSCNNNNNYFFCELEKRGNMWNYIFIVYVIIWFIFIYCLGVIRFWQPRMSNNNNNNIKGHKCVLRIKFCLMLCIIINIVLSLGSILFWVEETPIRKKNDNICSDNNNNNDCEKFNSYWGFSLWIKIVSIFAYFCYWYILK